MKQHGIAATPRNYEIWFAFCGTEKPALNQRIESILRTGDNITPGILDSLYRDYFAASVDVSVVRDGSQELQELTTQIADRVTADRMAVDSISSTFGALSNVLQTPLSPDELRRAAVTLGSTTAAAGDRLRAMETLFSASVRRISELRNKLAAAEQSATRDALTGLANRRMFDAALLRAAQYAAVDKEPLALLLLDIDHFKRFNDSYGHILGDNVLRLVGRLLADHTKGRDTAARYGGEEFAIILPGASLAGAVSVADQIRSVLERRPVVNRASGQRLGVVTCSIGASQYRTGEPVGDFVERADQALYRAKREGRNTVRAEAAS
ncbi:MAG: GGDEF domain-containing protein [Acetobacteraceae bacterium]